MNFEKITDHIEAVEILGNKRLSVLAKHFGSGCVVFEFAVYQMMSLLCPDYQGGYWAFYELSNGGFYMAPTDEEGYQVEVAGNGYQGRLSRDAMGIVATIFAFNYLANKTESENLIDKYYLVLDYSREHIEARKIYSAID